MSAGLCTAVRERRARSSIPLIGVAALALAGCGDTAKLTISAGTGATPTLPPP